MHIEAYQERHRALWDDFIHTSKNGHFLFHRHYMEYHQDRFTDHSLFIKDSQNRLLALLPAHQQGTTFASHLGLTYGGIISAKTMKVPLMLEIFQAVIHYLKEHAFTQFIYKTIPYIHHRVPADEDRYALFRVQAQLDRQDLLSIVKLDQLLPYQQQQTRAIQKAQRAGVTIEISHDFETYWSILTAPETRYIHPVHSLEEIRTLAERFPQHIKLYAAFLHKQMIAGAVIFETDRVVRTESMAASPDGKTTGALDRLFDHLMREVYTGKMFFDFGSSQEPNGSGLDLDLIDQKEGFGARTIVHDHYKIPLQEEI